MPSPFPESRSLQGATQLPVKSLLFCLVVLNLILAIPSLWVPYYNIDEITNTIYARFILEGKLGLKDFIGNTYLLTHYIYVGLAKFFSENVLLAAHIFHALWKSLAILAFYFAGKSLRDQKTGLWAALFYTACSYSFLSKDFHTPSAESFVILPTVLGIGFFFKGLTRERLGYFLSAGVFLGLATHFKMPVGIAVLPLGLILLFDAQKISEIAKRIFISSFGFLIIFLLPVIFVSPFPEGFVLMFQKIFETSQSYIKYYDTIPTSYVLVKVGVRSLFVLAAFFGMTVFALGIFHDLFQYDRSRRKSWQKIFFLCAFFLLQFYVVAIGKRVFYHYFVFFLIPLPLMAAWGITSKTIFVFFRRWILILLALPLIFFSYAGAKEWFIFSVPIKNISNYVRSSTKPSDTIYVWGNVHSLYYFSDRQPSTVYFWSEFLAGTSTGLISMNYVSTTGEELSGFEMFIKDFDLDQFKQQEGKWLEKRLISFPVSETELLKIEEILLATENPHWIQVMHDFIETPPALIIDASALNTRGFASFPLEKFELMKRFIFENYTRDQKIDGMFIYRKKSI